ncbi:MAG: metallophosphoesterase [Pyrobaculum sp.]
MYETFVVNRVLDNDAHIVFLGDLHIGADGSRFNDAISNLVAQLPENTYFAFLGDLVDMATKNSVANVYEQSLTPQAQISMVSDLLGQFKDRTLGVVQGNHDYRIVKEVGFDPIMEVCRIMKIPYSRSYMILHLEIEGQDFVFAMHHGMAGGRSKTASTRQGEYFERFLSYGVDVYVTGHTHKPAVVPFNHAAYDRTTKQIRYEQGFFVTIPSLVQDELYALKRLYEPASTMFPIVSVKVDSQKQKHIDIHWLKIL